MSGILREIEKPCAFQISRRTAANVSAKVGCCLPYQAAVQTAQRVRGASWAANNAIRENRPNKTGVVRAMALSVHWVGPLALALKAEVIAHLAEGHLD